MKIFNKQRFQLLKGRPFQKYLTYALGEIILVIIGILIALGISNWNQEKQLENANKDLQKKVLIQLDKDINAVGNFQKVIDSLHQTYLKVLGRDYDSDKVKDESMLSTVLFEVNTLSLDKHLNNLIDNAELDDSEASQQLIDLNSTYKLHLKKCDDIESIIFEKMKNNLAEIEKTQTWYLELITDFTCRNECINYLLKDEGHKARIASLRFLYVSGYGSLIGDFLDDLEMAKTALEAVVSE
ncbi:hypothetical protein [Psychroserpens sp.]|uniref:hypothetical protein n=1 Tax=Psychroserpens sp. TaxID=2020870 RepID=UPI002B274942|nr:hypothetical protein [Psychroserpens sp.]